jgi:hypothetical protein
MVSPKNDTKHLEGVYLLTPENSFGTGSGCLPLRHRTAFGRRFFCEGQVGNTAYGSWSRKKRVCERGAVV